MVRKRGGRDASESASNASIPVRKAAGSRLPASIAFVLGTCVIPLLLTYFGYFDSEDEHEMLELPMELRTLLRCAELCGTKGPSAEDKQFATRAPPHVRKLIEQDLTRACVMRCEAGLKTAEEEQGIQPISAYSKVPSQLSSYHTRAKSCVAESRRSRDIGEVSQALEVCGVLHLPGLIIDKALVGELQTAYKALRENREEYARRAGTGNLRAQRVELWPPFRWPFNTSEVLRPQKLEPALREYLGPGATFDHLSIIIAPGSAKPSRQRLHADVIRAKHHVEVHIPLADVSPSMGPTLFCPASHGFVHQGASQDWVTYGLEQWYFAQEHCKEDPYLSYQKPLKAGEVTIYDSNVWHAGSENQAGVDRPILQLSWAVDAASISQRDYMKDAFSEDTAFVGKVDRRKEIIADTELFRLAARRS